MYTETVKQQILAAHIAKSFQMEKGNYIVRPISRCSFSGTNTLTNQGPTISQKPRYSAVSVETCGYYKFWNFLIHVLRALSRYNVKMKGS